MVYMKGICILKADWYSDPDSLLQFGQFEFSFLFPLVLSGQSAEIIEILENRELRRSVILFEKIYGIEILQDRTNDGVILPICTYNNVKCVFEWDIII